MTAALLYFSNYKASWPLTSKWEAFHMWAEPVSGVASPSCPVSVLPNLCLCGAPEIQRLANLLLTPLPVNLHEVTLLDMSLG